MSRSAAWPHFIHLTRLGMDAPDAAGPAFDIGQLRRLCRGIYMTNHGYDRASVLAAVATGEADLVAFGTLFLANPDLVERLWRNAPFDSPEPATFQGGGEGAIPTIPS